MPDQRFMQMVKALADEIESDRSKYLLYVENCNGKKSCEDIFSFLWNLEDAQKCLIPKLFPPTKSEERATILREKGNEYYKKREYDKALQLYNQSIMEAPHPVISDADIGDNAGREEAYLSPLIHPSRYGGVTEGETPALADGFVNRSAVMLVLKLYEKCISDIDMAIKYGFPKDKQKTLEERREKCLAELKKTTSPKKKGSRVKRGSSESRGASSEPDLDFCEKILSALQLDTGKSPFHQILSYETRDAPEMTTVNKKVPALSSAVEYSFFPSKGRGLIATRKIKPGEVLGVEEAHSVYIAAQNLHQYCSSCLRLTFNPLPCPACPKVLYCNETCRMKALTEEHWLECSLFTTLLSLGMGERNIMCKMLKSLTYSQHNDFVSRLLKEEEENEGPVNPEKAFLLPQSYKSVYHLCSNKEQHTCAFILMQSQIAFVITKLLIQSGRFFVNDEGEPIEPTSEDIVKTGAALLYHAMQLHTNPFEINDYQVRVSVGAGVFPALSLINHSCTPSARQHNTGRTLAIRAMRPIAAGEEITISYVPEFHRKNLAERTRMLTNFKFSCTCEACLNNWPIFLELPSLEFKCLRCKTSMGARLFLCPACDSKPKRRGARDLSLPPDLEHQVDQTWQAIMGVCSIDVKINNGIKVTVEDYKFICKTLDHMHNHMVVPCQHISILQNLLYKCYSAGF